MNISITSLIVRNVNGSINHEATVAKFAGELSKFQAEQEVERAGIANAVHAIFDNHVGKRIPMPFLTGEVLRALNVQPENFKSLTEKVQDFIRTSPDFNVGKGKGGGVGRVEDLPLKG